MNEVFFDDVFPSRQMKSGVAATVNLFSLTNDFTLGDVTCGSLLRSVSICFFFFLFKYDLPVS